MNRSAQVTLQLVFRFSCKSTRILNTFYVPWLGQTFLGLISKFPIFTFDLTMTPTERFDDLHPFSNFQLTFPRFKRCWNNCTERSSEFVLAMWQCRIQRRFRLLKNVFTLDWLRTPAFKYRPLWPSSRRNTFNVVPELPIQLSQYFGLHWKILHRKMVLFKRNIAAKNR